MAKETFHLAALCNHTETPAQQAVGLDCNDQSISAWMLPLWSSSMDWNVGCHALFPQCNCYLHDGHEVLAANPSDCVFSVGRSLLACPQTGVGMHREPDLCVKICVPN